MNTATISFQKAGLPSGRQQWEKVSAKREECDGEESYMT
jgi:hypothetical protein